MRSIPRSVCPSEPSPNPPPDTKSVYPIGNLINEGEGTRGKIEVSVPLNAPLNTIEH